MWIRHTKIAVGLDFGLNDFAVQRRVEVKVHTKAVTVFIVHRCDGRQLDVALVLAHQPVHQIVLSVNAKVQSADGEVGQSTLTVSSKTLALTMKEVETVIEGFGVNVHDFDDAAHGHLVDQQFKNGFVLVMFPLPCRGLSVL